MLYCFNNTVTASLTRLRASISLEMVQTLDTNGCVNRQFSQVSRYESAVGTYSEEYEHAPKNFANKSAKIFKKLQRTPLKKKYRTIKTTELVRDRNNTKQQRCTIKKQEIYKFSVCIKSYSPYPNTNSDLTVYQMLLN